MACGIYAAAVAPAWSEESNKTPVIAEDQVAPESDSAESPDDSVQVSETTGTDYAAIEGTGIDISTPIHGLGKNIWQGSKRSNVTALLRELPDVIVIPTFQRVFHDMILAATDASLLENDVTPEAGKDLLTLRIEKLLSAGMYDRALELYALEGDDPYDPALARVGALAMLFSGEKSLSCLEGKAAQERFPDDSFLVRLASYCAGQAPGAEEQDAFAAIIRKEIAAKPDYKLAYTPSALDGLGMEDLAVLAAEKRVLAPSAAAIDLKAVKPAHIQILLGAPNTDDALRLRLSGLEARYGMIEIGALQKLYKTVFASLISADSPQASTIPPDLSPYSDPWVKVAILSIMTGKSKDPKEYIGMIKTALSLTDQTGLPPLVTFAEAISASSPAGLSAAEYLKCMKILYLAGVRVPEEWASYPFEIKETSENKEVHARALAAGFAAQVVHSKNASGKERAMAAVESLKNDDKAHFSDIIEIVDNSGKTSIMTDTAYEKDKFLTKPESYVMPTDVVWDRLKQADEGKAYAEALLLSGILVDSKATREIFPYDIGKMAGELNGLELVNISGDLLLGAALGDLEVN